VQERLRQAVYPLIVENVLAGLDHLRLDRGSSRRPSVRISPILRQLEGYFDQHMSTVIQDWIDEASLVDKDDLETLEELGKRALRRMKATVWMTTEKAHWYAYGMGAQALGLRSLAVRSLGASCQACSGRHGKPLALVDLMLDEVPPFHPECRCGLSLMEEDPQ